jgi:hypothetical protein
MFELVQKALLLLHSYFTYRHTLQCCHAISPRILHPNLRGMHNSGTWADTHVYKDSLHRLNLSYYQTALID